MGRCWVISKSSLQTPTVPLNAFVFGGLLGAASHLRRLDSVDDDTLVALSNLVNLETLDVSYFSKITNVGLGHLASLSKLHELNLEGCPLIRGVGLWVLPKQLRKLTIGGSGWLVDADLGALVGLSASLEVLKLHNCDKITDNGIRRHIGRLVNLRELSFAGAELISGIGLCALTDMLAVAAPPQLRVLDLGKCLQLVDDDLASLSEMVSLEVLSLYSCKLLTGSGMHHLSSLVNIQELNLKRCTGISGPELQPVLQKMPRLRVLDLGLCSNLWRRDVDFVVPVSLRVLHAEGCSSITGYIFHHQLAPLVNLQELNLSWVFKLHLPRLRKLQLISCEALVDDDILEISNGAKSLEYLALLGCDKITDDGLQHLASLPALRILHLSRGNCGGTTPDGRTQLLCALPQLKMTSY